MTKPERMTLSASKLKKQIAQSLTRFKKAGEPYDYPR